MPSRKRITALALAMMLAMMLTVTLALVTTGAARAQAAPTTLPTFAELEAAGARVGEIRILVRDIFDTTEPKEDKLLFRWANKLHIRTRPGVIERALLFKTGEPLSVRLLDETERILRSQQFLYDVKFRPAAVHDGVVDIDVETRDTWSLDLGASAGRAGGENTSGTHLKEYNLLGTGIAVSLGHSNGVDRSGNEFEFSNERAFGGWTTLSYRHATNSDGRSDAAAVVRPFYALDTRWAAGLSASRDERIDALYNAGEVVSQYRHHQERAEVFGGWSAGLVDGWVRRTTVGLSLQDDAYAPEPGFTAPAHLSPDEKLVSAFLRVDLLEDRVEKELNRNLIGRPEFFTLGLASSVQLGWAAKGLGSSGDALLYAGSMSRGFEPAPTQILTAAAQVSGQFAQGQVRRQRLGAQLRYYLPQSPRWLFYAAAAADRVTRPELGDMLQLGGDNGLRGYPLRYQCGERRAQFTLEERFYTDLYLWQLFRIGGAAFFDAGRAWGGDNVNTLNAGWLRNVGMGLRIVSARSAFSNVIHVDLAFPLQAVGDMKKVQFLVKSKTSF
jgi:hypothetical protein